MGVSGRRRSRAFPLIEALLASVILAAVVAPALLPFAAGARSQVVGTRQALAAGLAESLMEEVLLRPFEEPGDGEINVSEVLKIYFDAVTHQLIERSYVFPDTMAQDTRDAPDSTLSLEEVDDTSICEPGLLYPRYDTKRVLANDVRSFELQFSPDSPETKMVAFGLVVGEGDRAVKTRGAARLRADQVSRLGKSDDDDVPVWMGNSPPVDTNRPFDGLIDEVAIYRRCASEKEIRSLYKARVGSARILSWDR